MTDIIIDETQSGFLIKKLKDIFTPFVISEDIENELLFDNELGKGKFKILTLERDVISIYFSGVLHEELKFKFLNAKLPVLNLIYLNKGQLGVEYNENALNLNEGETQQFIYNSEIKEFEVLTWPAGKEIEFSFIKLFDFSYLNSQTLKDKFNDVKLKSSEPLRVIAKKSEAIKPSEILISSELVGKQRMKDLECQVYNLLNIQLEEILGKQ